MRAEVVVDDELDAIVPFEVLSIAARTVELSLALAGADARLSVRTAHGLELRVPAVLGAPDVLIVPGSGWSAGDHTPCGARCAGRVRCAAGRRPRRRRW